MSAEQLSAEQLSRSKCRGAIVAFCGAFVTGVIVAGACVGLPDSSLGNEAYVVMCSIQLWHVVQDIWTTTWNMGVSSWSNQVVIPCSHYFI